MNNYFNFELEPGRVLEPVDYLDYKKVVSIITPTYNPNDFLLQTAASILNQTYPYFEWLIIDDGSTDSESLKLLNKIKKMDKRINVYHKKNEGVSKARDYGASKSSSECEYIMFIDDDDLIEKTYLEISYYSMCCNPKASWCYSDVVNFSGEQALWNKMFSCERMKHENLLVSQALIKKNAFYDVGGFDLSGHGHYEDWVFWLKMMAKGHFPIHMSYYGFWYRRKKESGQLKASTMMHKRNMKEIKEYASKIKTDVCPIEFPRECHNWDYIIERNESFIRPIYKTNSDKINILAIVPWMTVGGADKFNLDLFKMIDREKFSITLVSCQPTQYIWRQQFEECCDAVYDISSFIDRKDWPSFISYLIETKGINTIFNTNSVAGYMMLPYLKSKYPNIPIIDYIHMEEWYNRNGGYSRDSASVSSVIDRTLFCNKKSEQIMVDFFGREKEKVNTVYIGVDPEKFNPSNYDREELRKKYEIDSSKFVVSIIARIDYQKRPFLLMKIIEKFVLNSTVKNVLFVIAGDGPLLDSIKGISKRKKLDSFIKFIGATKKPDEIYAISDVTINCSIKEGLALTSYESLSMGVPVISSDVGGQSELINSDVGVIVPCLQEEKDINDFNYSDEEIDNYVNALNKIHDDYDFFKKNCRSRILKSFTIDHMVSNMEKEFTNVYNDYKKKLNVSYTSDVYLELINQYLLADKKLYSWLCDEYYRKIYGYSSCNGKRTLKNLFRNFMWKFPLWRKMILYIKNR